MKRPPLQPLRWLPLWLLLTLGASADPIVVGTPDEQGMLQWQRREFAAETHYRAVEIDGRPAIGAVSRAAASALINEIEIDLTTTPWLEWSWRIGNRLQGNDERSREGDDYPARLYLLFRGHWLDPRPLAINYVWSSHQPAGSHWPNAYTERVVMVALRGPEDPLNQLLVERRNLADDLRRYFGREVERIGAVAIMSDSDNSGGEVSAWYGAIRFSGRGDGDGR